MVKVVEGVLNGSAAAGGNGSKWSLIFELTPWRFVGSDDLPAKPLRVEVPTSETLASRWMGRLSDDATVQLTVRRFEANARYYDGPPAPWSLAICKLPIRRVKGSTQLRAAKAARDVPVVIRDEILGKLVLEREFAWFAGKVTVCGRRVALSIEQSGRTEDRLRDQRTIARARTIVARLETSWSTIEKRIAREKLPLYNDTWRERGPALTVKQFLARLRLSSIQIGPTRVTLYFKDGGLFLDHLIEVRMSPRGAISEVVLAG